MNFVKVVMLSNPYLLIGFAFIVLLIVWEAPVLPIFRLKRCRLVRADRATVWRHLMARPSPRFVSEAPDPGADNRFRLVVDGSNGRRDQLRAETFEPIQVIDNERYERRIVAIHDFDYTPAASIHETLTLTDHPDGTLVTLTQERRIMLSLSMMLAWRRALYDTLDYLVEAAEAPAAKDHQAAAAEHDAAQRGRWRRRLVNNLLSLFSVACVGYLFDWRIAALLVAAVFVHEFGHWLAFRIAGHANIRFIPLPFVGGAIASDRPFRSAREEAFVSLMGPGVSAMLAFSLLMIAGSSGANLIDLYGQKPSAAYIDAHFTGIMLVAAAAIIGVANLFQMIPVPPLDGGHVWRALVHGRRRWFVRFVFPVIGAGAVVMTLAHVGPLPALALALLCIIWPTAIATHLAVPAMRPWEKVFMGSAYISIAGLHAIPVFILVRPLIG